MQSEALKAATYRNEDNDDADRQENGSKHARADDQPDDRADDEARSHDDRNPRSRRRRHRRTRKSLIRGATAKA
jgi:hypothetical protein